MKCPNCGGQSDGAYCSNCGAPLKGAKCRECNAVLTAGARFCNNCGTATGRGRTDDAGGSSKMPWIFAGGSLLVLVGVLAWPALKGGNSNEPDDRLPLSQMNGAGPAGGAAAPGPLTGTPREQADRLFNRIMTERESGDTAAAKRFVPMAVQAYDMAGPLDADALYHLSLVNHVGGDYKAARDAADRILATSPNHLLALSAAASAARSAGDDAAARSYYQKFLQNYDVESKNTKQEYLDHGKILPGVKTEAEAFLKAR